MDFAVPDFVMSAIHKRMEHPIFGYTDTPETIQNTFIDWLHRKYHWDIEPEWLMDQPGVQDDRCSRRNDTRWAGDRYDPAHS